MLLMAGALKRALPRQEDEALVAIRALRGANLPRLLSDVSAGCLVDTARGFECALTASEWRALHSGTRCCTPRLHAGRGAV